MKLVKCLLLIFFSFPVLGDISNVRRDREKIKTGKFPTADFEKPQQQEEKNLKGENAQKAKKSDLRDSKKEVERKQKGN
jgi:hypothetical protein